MHSAFWRTDTNEEAYIGDIIQELSKRADSGDPPILIGVGPQTSLKARGWRQRLSEFTHGTSQVPFRRIEDLATSGRLSTAGIWKQARRDERILHGSSDLRRAARIRGCDVWSILRHELSGIALLQLPWSRRAMDQAASALDTLGPSVIFTYAEAGGWGRALVLEARRRSIVSVGLQHGFIYRHWLNYLHDADEMHPSRANAADRGFPRPDLTLVFDRLAERYLRDCGRFPAGAIRVTGSARLDALVSRFHALTGEDRRRLRNAIGAGDNPIILVTSKFSQIQALLPAVVDWVVRHPNVRLVIKAHPAEPPAIYQGVTGAARNTTILPASADLAALLAVSALLVTVNSTVALEAMTLDVPALVLGLPNNLSPFVEVGALAGAERAEQIGPVLDALLYDEGRRSQLATARRAFIEHFGLMSDGRAAARAAEAILVLSRVGIGGQGP
ncbi:MAG: hypothetical protein HY654_07295 [Acidobacteria bacterium]|nr:hypothetical protein [Acidobacteriota bacterium]